MLALFICIAACSCAATAVREDSSPGRGPNGDNDGGELRIDVDLTKLSSTMVYAEVYNMMSAPELYTGSGIRMKGNFAHFEGNGRHYFSCVIADATACCAQGIEFVLKDERKYPDEYPEEGNEITVSGVFDIYYEGETMYAQLIDAVIEWK